MTGKKIESHFDAGIASSVMRGRRLILRGTNEWDDREKTRRGVGCTCMSFGSLRDSIITKGKSAQYDPRDLY